MTSTDVLAALWRRWYILLACLAITAATLLNARAVPGVYSSTVDVYIVPPANTVGNQLGNSYRALVSMAGLVSVMVNPEPSFIGPVDKNVNILSMGYYDETTITLPNDGGQWEKYFDSPFLRVAASGPSPEVVEQRRDRAVARINGALTEIQDRDDLAAGDRMTTTNYPAQPSVGYTTGRPTRALGAIFGLGVGLSVFATVLFDQWARRRTPLRVRRRERELVPTP